MRVLLDENIPVQLRGFLSGHDVASVNDALLGWKNIKNGLLLERMAGRFDLLITADQSMYAQQDLSGRPFSILVLPTNRRRLVLAFGQTIGKLIEQTSIGQYIVVAMSGEVSVKPLSSREDR